MGIFENEEYGPTAGELLELTKKCLERLYLSALRTEFRRQSGIGDRQRQEPGKKHEFLVRGRAASQECLELFELAARRIVTADAGCARKLVDEWIKRGIGMMGRAEILQSGMRLRPQMLLQSDNEARFPEARLAGNQDDLACAGL